MIWKKIQHPVLTYSFVAFLFSCVFCAFGMSQESYATSVTCSFSDLAYSTSNYNFSTYCDSWFTPTSGTIYFSSPLYIYDFSGSFSSLQPDSYVNTINFYSTSGYYSNFYLGSSSDTSISFSFSGVIYVSSFVYSTGDHTGYYALSHFKFSRSIGVTFSGTFKVTDDITDIYPACTVCPDISENPYDNKLDDIKKAIYVCGAILIMLYFFFCIYKIIVKDGGSR